MIVRQFLQWMRTAPAAERGDATAALARAYLYSDLGPDDRAATEGALIMLLDDPSPVVRAALARALAFTEQAPPAVILGLAADQPEIASWVLEYSPLLLDADLVDAVATGSPQNQIAIANRSDLPRSVSAAIAEVGCAEACLVLVENPRAAIATLSVSKCRHASIDSPWRRTQHDRSSISAMDAHGSGCRAGRRNRRLGACLSLFRPRPGRSRRTASWRVMVISGPCGRRCCNAMTCRRRPARPWLPSSLKRLRILSPPVHGWSRIALSAWPGTRAKGLP
jgi:hypothetical protein